MAPGTTAPPLDDLDNYDIDDFDDPFRSPSPQPQAQTQNGSSQKRKIDGLGLDEEVDVAKRARVPRIKLDETRLLSEDGIPKLRRRAADLKLKGKGHEFSDAARLLTFYQFWLDDLFPKAKFLDGLAMVEKAGHKRTLQSKRIEWIDELKPRASAAADDEDEKPRADEGPRQHGDDTGGEAMAQRNGRAEMTAANTRPKTPMALDEDDVPDEADLYGATPKRTAAGTTSVPRPADPDDEDDLEALMAEAEAETGPRREPEGKVAPAVNDYEDDEAAMAEMDGLW
ncbi:Chromosome segregation in meiosis protein 3 like [Verticillium longisporum]|uniref:Chromosome segregation in meiosis protein n=3 Tax=Verticillium TaxID=1036719 RepID=G2X3E7_VERDV|nr:Swi3 domain-containing protein [Verticillium dahliae VdLs.17]KAF3349149.1 Cyanide hydratase [Verticillium dahliae VDG2]KAF3352815.1 hypothetical protein VdG1_08636 [Verticillium dahliae VDG1]KAG7130406.1 Chromosome segregation in meiosis protein 3 like [Verticillium longisporum]KAH6705861.1 Swi3 domain-containing protein [Verticillium dahliae]EGY23494.1 Swi3 domain-containing protein [Verticillium dahliae VdLs.17]